MYKITRQLYIEIRGQVSSKVYMELYTQVYDQVWYQVRDQVRDQVQFPVYGRMMRPLNESLKNEFNR
jgi:hypothetical protein